MGSVSMVESGRFCGFSWWPYPRIGRIGCPAGIYGLHVRASVLSHTRTFPLRRNRHTHACAFWNLEVPVVFCL